jgi:hypothetical protein
VGFLFVGVRVGFFSDRNDIDGAVEGEDCAERED